ncbi:hypothetical protein OBBRIDRAFT_839553 [Obba rivulosa]|uniref:Uncharacterized protein n=1 Tax=Obba rivulosa TaxID=1052685 RepID=A0A8E2ALW2_9APHY|nr:hypothetical protein OBBRIDRAFT_839553 [Obba rivulosa]
MRAKQRPLSARSQRFLPPRLVHRRTPHRQQVYLHNSCTQTPCARQPLVPAHDAWYLHHLVQAPTDGLVPTHDARLAHHQPPPSSPSAFSLPSLSIDFPCPALVPTMLPFTCAQQRPPSVRSQQFPPRLPPPSSPEGQNLRLLRWGEFVKAMTHVGFKYYSKGAGGSGRVFEPNDFPARKKFVWDEPHGPKKGRNGAFTHRTQSRVARKLGVLYGWDGETFVHRDSS